MNINDLQFILVRYGSDTGLISLAARAIVCHTVETGDGGLEWPRDIPIVDFSDESKFTRLLRQDPDEPRHNWDDVLQYVLAHAAEIISGGRPPVTEFYARVVTMQVACMAEDAEEVKLSLFGPDGRPCWYLDHNCPLGPIRVDIRLPTTAEEVDARDALDVEEPGQEADHA